PQAVEDAKTIRLVDVLQVHVADRGRDELHRLDNHLRFLRGERDREGVDPAQIFEQESLALHDREAGLWADVPEAEDPRAVRHDGNLVPFVRQAPDQLRVRLDVEAGLSHAGRVPDREVVEAPDGDPRDHFDLPLVVRVVDRARRGGTRKVKAAFEAVETRYAEFGHTLQRPVSGEIVAIPIMGASKSLKDRYTLSVSSRAVESGLVDGLIAHEGGHMLRTEARHPSHSPEVYRLIAKEVRIPRAAEAAFGQAFNHVQDVYADDLAFPVFAGADGRRAY